MTHTLPVTERGWNGMVMLQRDESEQGVYQAARDCGHCAQCGRELKPQEPVWRGGVSLLQKAQDARGTALYPCTRV